MAPARIEGVIARKRRTPIGKDLDEQPVVQKGRGEIFEHVGQTHPRAGSPYECVAVIDDQGRRHFYRLRMSVFLKRPRRQGATRVSETDAAVGRHVTRRVRRIAAVEIPGRPHNDSAQVGPNGHGDHVHFQVFAQPYPDIEPLGNDVDMPVLHAQLAVDRRVVARAGVLSQRVCAALGEALEGCMRAGREHRRHREELAVWARSLGLVILENDAAAMLQAKQRGNTAREEVVTTYSRYRHFAALHAELQRCMPGHPSFATTEFPVPKLIFHTESAPHATAKSTKGAAGKR